MRTELLSIVEWALSKDKDRAHIRPMQRFLRFYERYREYIKRALALDESYEDEPVYVYRIYFSVCADEQTLAEMKAFTATL